MVRQALNFLVEEMWDSEGEEEETDEIVNQVLDEIGINLSSAVSETLRKSLISQLVDTPAGRAPAVKTTAPKMALAEADEDRALQDRLNNLRQDTQ
jgi:charged multivesicular body protein 2A